VIDSQSVKATESGAWGYDAGKKVRGRKRHLDPHGHAQNSKILLSFMNF
jgi:hypothetical protein